VDGQRTHERIRLVLLDDHALFRESLAQLLASEGDFEVVAQCSTTLEALNSLKDAKVDIVLVDLGIAKDFIYLARKAHYSGKSLVMARQVDVKSSAVVLKYGASGIFQDSQSPTRLLQAIRMVASGEAWVDQKIIQLLADVYPVYEDNWSGQLTDKEQNVLKGVVDGWSNKKIGMQIGASESSVKAILQQLFNKAGVRRRTQLVRIALEGPSIGRSNANHENGAAQR